MSIEQDFDIAFVAEHALREKQLQQRYRPIVAVHKWFARRPGSLFRALALSEFGGQPLAHAYFRAHDFAGCRVADPFVGGGTPLVEANRLGCDVTGFDVNPMATWIVREELAGLDVSAYRREAEALLTALRRELGTFFATDCPLYGDRDVPVKYVLWVKRMDCVDCGRGVDLFPGYTVAERGRHPVNVLVCSHCGELNDVASRDEPGTCSDCDTPLRATGPARRGRCACPACGRVNAYPDPTHGPLRHRPFAIEYDNPHRVAEHAGRFFKRPDAKDLQRLEEVERRWAETVPRFVPTEAIEGGEETDRLHRWGYERYRDMFSVRQLLGLELSCRRIAEVGDPRLRRALATNLSDLLRYQNLLCRYDTRALKSLDIFSVHGFPVGLIQCESNLLGIVNERGTVVGSGGWRNVIEKYAKAKDYCERPFEVERRGSRNVRVPVEGESIGESAGRARAKQVTIRCADATSVDLEPESLDAVLTDPPYFDNVQYGELMDFCYVWLRRLVDDDDEGFAKTSTRTGDELTGKSSHSWNLARFAEGLARVYRRMAEALKPGAPLVFTYHHNALEAYAAIGMAILDAGLVCSASLPCPAEMGGSIHIHGTGSSIVDTVFVCRRQGRVPRKWLFRSAEELKALVREELAALEEGGRTPTAGDTRCILIGHLTRMAIWELARPWRAEAATDEKLCAVDERLRAYGEPEKLLEEVRAEDAPEPMLGPLFRAATERRTDAVAF